VVTKEFDVAIIGATGAVGAEFVDLFAKRQFPIKNLRLLASPRSVGKQIEFQEKIITVAEADINSVKGADIVFFSAGAERSRRLAPAAVEQGALVIDNSSAFRMDPTVPLVVPEVNPDTLTLGTRLISVPNCTAIILVVAVNPLRSLGAIDRLIVSTYQSASGGGAAVMDYLESDTRAFLDGSTRPTKPGLPPYAFNLFSHNTPVGENGYNEEEQKVIEESRKILGLPSLKVNVTCVRVPVLRAHTETVTVEFAGPAPSVEAVRACLAAAPGVRVVDDREANHFPTPAEASGQGDVLVGRIRQDLSNPNAISMLIAGDQLLKGAALNAVQIAEAYLAKFPDGK
jgi:aspartate-semialdehyde dehydrogenase